MSLSRGVDRFPVKAGDRMPWFQVDGASIYDRLREPVFHLIGFFDGKTEIPPLPIDLMQEWAGAIDSTVISLYPNIADIFGTRESFYVILRPDNYIGLISNDFSPDTVRGYLNLVSARSFATNYRCTNKVGSRMPQFIRVIRAIRG
jgi:hypothetical protein